MSIRDTLIIGLQEGLPAVGSALGGLMLQRGRHSAWKVAAGSVLGWFIGYGGQKALFSMTSPRAQIPEQPGGLAPQYSPNTPPEQMPMPSTTSSPAPTPISDGPATTPGNAAGVGRLRVVNPDIAGLDPSGLGKV